MNRRSRTISAVVLICFVVVVAGALLLFLTYGKQYFDWDMQGIWITADGQILGTELISVSGYVVDNDDEIYDNVHMKFHFPGGENYLDMRSDTGDFSYTQWNYHVSYFGASSMSIDAHDGDWVEFRYALDLDKGFIFFQWDDGSERYLVASTDSDAEAADIVTHFKLFVENHTFG